MANNRQIELRRRGGGLLGLLCLVGRGLVGFGLFRRSFRGGGGRVSSKRNSRGGEHENRERSGDNVTSHRYPL